MNTVFVIRYVGVVEGKEGTESTERAREATGTGQRLYRQEASGRDPAVHAGPGEGPIQGPGVPRPQIGAVQIREGPQLPCRKLSSCPLCLQVFDFFILVCEIVFLLRFNF